MYSIDGIPLEDAGRGWALEASTAPLSAYTVERTTARIPGLPGVLAGVDRSLESLAPPAPVFVVETPRENYGALAALVMSGSVLSLTDVEGRVAPYECMSVSPSGVTPGDAIVNATCVLRIPGVFWRDEQTSTVTMPLAAASVAVNLWDGGGLVTDAVIRVRGAIDGLRLSSGYAYVDAPNIPAGSYFRYECATGRAFVTTSNTWSGGTEVTVGMDGPGGKFGVFPTRVDVDSWQSRLTVTSTARTNALVEVQGRGAYLVEA